MADENADNAIVMGRGNITLADVNANMEKKLAEVLIESKHLLAGNCLANTPIEDQTQYMPKKSTVFYIDTNALRESGVDALANNVEARQNKMLAARKSANMAFDAALQAVDPETAAKAVQVLNHAKEAIYFREYNNYHQQVSNSPASDKNSRAELEVSWAKAALAEQLANGGFRREIDARLLNGLPVVCEDNSLVR
jgi:hypothetical protein